jgi:DNA invertase Pin-like site-specific DNA recombinase
MQTNFSSPPPQSTAYDSTTGRFSGINSTYMTKAALYARVSTDAQKQEGTIKSQVLELKRQIVAAGHLLVKEYIDDGLSGTQLDRPGLDEMRKDIKTGVFEAIYFLDTDRIARDVAYQSIILSTGNKSSSRARITSTTQKTSSR